MLMTANLGAVPNAQRTPKEMMSVGKTDDGRPLIRINSSSLDILQTCWRKAEYALVRKLTSATEPAATLYGSAHHAALEVFYSGDRKERIIPQNFKDLLESMRFGAEADDASEFLLIRAARAFLSKAQPLAALPDSDKRSLTAGLWTLEHYFRTYINDPYHVYCDEEGPLVERMFTYRILDSAALAIDIFGTIDVVLQHESTGQILPCDHKTSSSLYGFLKTLRPNHQYTAYLLGCKNALDIEGDQFLVNCIEVKSIPKTARGSIPSFPRQITSRSEEDYEEYRKTLIAYCDDFMEKKFSAFWPLATNKACTIYSGCQYHEICSADPRIRENIIKANYEGETDDQA